ncbi:uncharacterized ferritin-like protein (DUF455 family) [Paraburkholderia unamae]|uniref:ferritin-like domain-containing protein n=1 Tax=Paraburkholderia unamae TaxID=219649 RepID=UPI000DC5AC7A|nr:ferritin-like domain-containing protein [Paraburkholderia unamae]RAR60111.1 uncharacterized ferritin-like protein (DUF455 family) [Paraburkholderia unamae]
MNSVFSAVQGSHAPQAGAASEPSDASGIPVSWREAALDALRERDPLAKANAVRALYAQAQDPAPRWDPQRVIAAPDGLPGRPAQPALVEPRELKRRAMSTPQGRVVLLHALAHIEFNAINLALDAVWRFPAMPDAFYADWLKVAAEEAYHFSLLRKRLADYGHAYGDFPAHNGLWEMCERTSADVLARMALVPRVLEARGLDAAPPIRTRLKQAGDDESAAILDIILRDEVGHVHIGNHWFRHLCEVRGLDPHAAWLTLAEQYHAPRMRGPFNFEARRSAGFDEAELSTLAAQDAAEQVATKVSTKVSTEHGSTE